jgi:Tfp pilus assembly protein PilF
VLKRDPKFYPALVGQGDVARVKQDHALAESKYRAALTLAEDPFARAGLGLVLAAQGKNDEARVELRKAINAQPEQPAALSVLVKLSLEAKDPETVNAAQALADLRPKDRDARKMLADLRFDLGDKAAAAKEYERLVRLGNAELPVLQRLTTLYRFLNDAEGEERTLQIIAAMDEKGADANMRIAELRYARKDLEGAEGQWLEALVRDPKRVEARESIAKLRVDAGVLHEALDEYRKAFAIDPTRSETAAAIVKLEADFKLPKKKARGAPTNVYWAVQASLGKFFDERKLQKRGLEGKYKLRVRISKEGAVEGVDVLEDGLNDPLLLGHVYFGLRDAEYAKGKSEPVFEFELGAKKKAKGLGADGGGGK